MSSPGKRTKCAVCGDFAVGYRFGVVCCGSCNQFFSIQDRSGKIHECVKRQGKCVVTKKTRASCTSCRFQKCMEVGMNRSHCPAKWAKHFPNQKCAVCGDLALGNYYGVACCKSCCDFFRRHETSWRPHKCIEGNGKCVVNKDTRSICKSCRLKKCLEVGMKRSRVESFPETKCLVCGDVSGVTHHYGAESCGTCANFFRKTLSHGRAVECVEGQGKCVVTRETRAWCKLCRLKKCLSAGMNPSFACLNEESVGDQYKRMPILEKMKMGYGKLEALRNELHRRNGDNISEERIPRSLKFQECLNQLSKEIHLLANWCFEWCFDEFHTLAVDQKALLFFNFLPVFTIFERTCVTSKFGKKNQLLLSSGDFVEIDKLEEFFTDEEKGISGKEMAKLFQPSVKLYNTFHDLLSTENVDLLEFFTLTVFLFWDHGLVGQSEECMSSSRRMNSAIAEEYFHYQKYFKKKKIPTTEMAKIVPILTCLQRVSNRIRRDMSVAHVFDYFTMPKNAISTFVGRYS